ncbi:MAG: helix-turn-helix domain-containing protein [Firmicutes bacterium]|nr:helix-turn-helix domain-containing protein [Bacillota bacterium]
MEQYYTPEEVANLLKINRETLYRWVREGRIKAKKIGTLLRIPESELKRFLESGGDEPAREE